MPYGCACTGDPVTITEEVSRLSATWLAEKTWTKSYWLAWRTWKGTKRLMDWNHFPDPSQKLFRFFKNHLISEK